MAPAMALVLFDEGEDEKGAGEGPKAEGEAVELSVERKRYDTCK